MNKVICTKSQLRWFRVGEVYDAIFKEDRENHEMWLVFDNEEPKLDWLSIKEGDVVNIPFGAKFEVAE